MNIGKRLIFDKITGKVLNNCLDEMSGDLQEGLRPLEIDFLDLPFRYNENNFKEAIEYHIDTETKGIVITKYMEHIETDAEKIAKLENIILEGEGLV